MRGLSGSIASAPAGERRGLGRATAAALSAAVAAASVGLAAASGSPAAADVGGNVLTIDAGSVVRPVTHVAAGGLYALATSTTPDPSLLPPLHLNQLTQPAPGVTQLGNGATTPTGDALKIAGSMIAAGAQETVRMPDIYPNFPYRWVSWSDYLSKVDTMVQARLAATDTTNINGWELWNEPDGTWNTAAAGAFNDGWAKIYNEVRKYDKITPIVGPSISSYKHSWMVSFLTAAKASNTVPDVISWHLWNPDTLQADLSDLRSVEASLGISPRPVSINEYAWMNQVDVPSGSLRYLATFERNTDVRDAERAYWYESGTVDGLLYNGQPTSTYWMYRWYGDMTGNMVSVQQNGVQDGIASLDATRKVFNAVVGGATGDSTISIKNLSGFGSKVKVTVSYVGDSGRLHNTAAPTPLGTQNLKVASDGTVNVPITGQDPGGAYDIVITPTTGPTSTYQQVYEAENATIVNGTRESSPAASNGYYVDGLTGTGDERSDSFVDFTVNAPVAGAYDLKVAYSSSGAAEATQGLSVNGAAWNTLTYPATGSGSFGTVDGPTVNLEKGYNVIRLAKGSPGFAGGEGSISLDSITLTSQSAVPAPNTPSNQTPVTFSTRVEAETSTVSDGQKLLSGNASNGGYVGTLNNADSYVEFPVSVPKDGTYTVTIGYANGGGNSQNGTTDAVQAMSVDGASPTEVTYPVSGSWGGQGGSFAQHDVSVALQKGANTIRLTRIPGQNYAELDYIQVSRAG